MTSSRLLAIILTTVCIIVAITGKVRADDLKARKANQAEIGMTVNCAVMNSRFEPGKDTQVIDYGGKSYYFCCKHCVDDFKKNPDKYAASGELPMHPPPKGEIGKDKRCPVSGAKFQVTRFTPVIDYGGKSYYFCCLSCVDEFKGNPDKYSK